MQDESRRKKFRNTENVFAKKSFGQNFLVDRNYIRKVIHALDLQPNETIIEIGAGRGALTEKLLESGAKVYAIEFERDMVAVLRQKFETTENFHLVESDALKVDFSSFIAHSSYLKSKLIANLPYYISTAILQKLITQRKVFSEMILMFQKEVVERITAKSGTSERGFLTILTEAFLKSEKLFDVPPEAFRPVPKVWSSVVKLTPRYEIEISNEKSFEQFISQAFRQKRKTLRNNLKNIQIGNIESDDLESKFNFAGISPDSRAESLTVEEWAKLFDAFYR